MKRIIALVICGLLFCCSIGYASSGFNVNDYSDEELARIYSAVSAKVFDCVRVPAGLYVVGKDLPAGVYTVLLNSEVAHNSDSDFSHVAVFNSMEDYKQDPDDFFSENSKAVIACNTIWNGFSYELTDGMVLAVKMGKAGITKHSKNLFAAFWDNEDEIIPAAVQESANKETEENNSKEELLNDNDNEEREIEKAEDVADIVTGESKPGIIYKDADGWDITKNYIYNDRYGYYCLVRFKHSFPIDQKTYVTFTFYDKGDNIIGVVEDYVGCTGSGFDYIAKGRNEAEYDHVVVSFASTDLKKTTDCMDGIKITSSRVDKKIIVSAENVGDKPISNCKLDVIYFDENENVVDSAWTYLSIPDSEMQKGDIINEQIMKYMGDFNSYELYYNACNFGNK